MLGLNTGSLRRRCWPSIAMAFSVCLGGCLFDIEDKSPESARIVVEGDAGLSIQVATSTRFLAGSTFDGGQASVSLELLEADTVVRSLPIDTTVDIRGTGRIFVVLLATADGTPAVISFEAWLDGERRAIQSADLSLGDLTFLFVFGDGVLAGDIIVL